MLNEIGDLAPVNARHPAMDTDGLGLGETCNGVGGSSHRVSVIFPFLTSVAGKKAFCVVGVPVDQVEGPYAISTSKSSTHCG